MEWTEGKNKGVWYFYKGYTQKYLDEEQKIEFFNKYVMNWRKEQGCMIFLQRSYSEMFRWETENWILIAKKTFLWPFKTCEKCNL